MRVDVVSTNRRHGGTVPYQGLPEGLYLVKQRSAAKRVDHYGILDIGNRLGYGSSPAVIHQTPPGIRVDWLEGTGIWLAVGRIEDEAGAITRLNVALTDRRYNLFGNNCEHFAWFVAAGRRESRQLQGVVAVAGIVALIALASGKRAA